MDERSAGGRKKPVILISLFVMLTLLTLAAIAGVSYGFYTGWLTPYWSNLSDAHAAVLAQLIFFFGAAWAAVLVPLLFGEQLENVERAANSAKETCESIEKRMKDVADETSRQMQRSAQEARDEFKKIIRLQTMAVGHLHKDQLAFLETPEERNDFIDTRWDKAWPKLNQALSYLDGNALRAIKNAGNKRTSTWWDKLKVYGVLGAHHDDFKSLSGLAARATAALTQQDVEAANEAFRRIESFDPSEARAVQSEIAPAESAPSFIRNGPEQSSQLHQ
ncbi:MAG: hypothetical protein M0D54_17575 [Hyphomonadaceae bacterium JAD_PAG50586_4]|nr:MAG: hypothetical protein M0D54_17575 [Hyphomonadaceae bacterium JAD_PAG50586_4]